MVLTSPNVSPKKRWTNIGKIYRKRTWKKTSQHQYSRSSQRCRGLETPKFGPKFLAHPILGSPWFRDLEGTNLQDPPLYLQAKSINKNRVSLSRFSHSIESYLKFPKCSHISPELRRKLTNIPQLSMVFVHIFATDEKSHYSCFALVNGNSSYRPIFQGYVRGYTPKIWPCMLRYPHVRMLRNSHWPWPSWLCNIMADRGPAPDRSEPQPRRLREARGWHGEIRHGFLGNAAGDRRKPRGFP